MSVSIRKNDDELDPKDTLAASPEGNSAPMGEDNAKLINEAEGEVETDETLEADAVETDEVTEPGEKEPEQEL